MRAVAVLGSHSGLVWFALLVSPCTFCAAGSLGRVLACHLRALRAIMIKNFSPFARRKKGPGWEGPDSRQGTVSAERCVEEASAS